MDSEGRMTLVMRACPLSANLNGGRFRFSAETILTVRERGLLERVSVLAVDKELDGSYDLDAIAAVFLGLLEVSTDPSVRLSDVIEHLSELFELGRFRPLSKLEQIGLVGELLVIMRANDVEYAVRCWRSGDRDRYDFSSPGERVEVKTTTGTTRIHNFSSSQIPGPADCNVLIASVLLSIVEVGQTIEELIELISSRLPSRVTRAELQAKAQVVIGQRINDEGDIRFDLQSSLASIHFVSSSIVPRPLQVPGVIRMSWEALVEDLSTPPSMGPLSKAVLL